MHAPPVLTLTAHAARLTTDAADCVAETDTPAPAGWHHVAATWNGEELVFWQGRAPVVEVPCPGALGLADSTRIGGHEDGTPFGGALGAVRITPAALPPAAFLGQPLEWRPRSADP